MNDTLQIAGGALLGITTSSVFVLALFIGFCVAFGFYKTQRSAGNRMVVKSLDEAVNRRAVVYLLPTAPRGPSDVLHAPELLEAAARKS